MHFTHAKIIARSAHPEEYHRQSAARGDKAYAVSSSMLREFFHCPARWLAGYIPPDSEEKDWGSLLDCLHLTPEQFGARYVKHPDTYKVFGMECPKCKSVTDSKQCRKCGCERVRKAITRQWNANADECKEWFAAHDGIEVVSAAKVAEANAAIARLMAHDIIRAWREASDTQVWVAADWKDEATSLVIPCRCLVDYVPRADTEFSKCAGDLKTTRSAGRKAFDRQCFQRGWHVQAAFDLDMLAAATGEDRNTWCFVVQENYAPWQPACRMLSQAFLQIGRQTYQAALDRYARCLADNHWPDYDDHEDAVDGWSLIEPEPWMEFEVVSEAMRRQQARLVEAVSPEPDDLIP